MVISRVKERRRTGYLDIRPIVLTLIFVNVLTVLPQDQNTRAAHIEQLSLSKPLLSIWQYETPDIIDLTPQIYKELIFVPLSKGKVVSLRLRDGDLVWKAEVGGEITASPLAEEQIVYVASAEAPPAGDSDSKTPTGALRALGQKSGVTIWLSKLPLPLQGALGANATTIFGCSTDGRVFAIRKADGRIIWVKKSERAFTTSPLVQNERVYLGGADGTVFALDQNTGAIIWRYRTGAAVSSDLALIGRALFVGAANYFAYALSLTDGRLLWRYRTGGRVQSIVATQRGVLITSLDNFAYLLTPQSGKRLWKRLLIGRVAAPPVTTLEGALFAPLSGEECVILDLKSGKRVNSIYVGDGNNTSAAPLISGRILILTTRKGLLALTDSVSPQT